MALVAAAAVVVGLSDAEFQPERVAASGIVTISSGGLRTCTVTGIAVLDCWGWNLDSQPVDYGFSMVAGVSTVSAGLASDFCLLTTSGGVKCWGDDYGSNTPIDIAGLTSGVARISQGEDHACARMVSGGVKCWGNNFYGQLGDGTCCGSSATPVDVVGLMNVAEISAGAEHTCALTTVGGVKCWGHGTYGELGDGSSTNQSAPVNVSGLASGVASVAVGGTYSCARSSTGGVKCWGGGYGPTPTDVSGLASGVAMISAGAYHTCAVTTAGALKCWGSNIDGQLGDGTTTYRTTPVDVVGLSSGVAEVAAGALHTCARMTIGDIKCWGRYTGLQTCNGDRCSTTPLDMAAMSAKAVGGITSLPTVAAIRHSSSRGGIIAAIIIGASLAVMVLPGGAWYARRARAR